MKTILEYIISKSSKRYTVKANNDNIYQIVKDEIKRLGNSADLNHIDVAKVTSFYNENESLGLCFGASFNGDVSGWNVSNCENFTGVFYKCNEFEGNLEEWDMSNAKETPSMFRYCFRFNSDIGKWRLPKLQNAYKMFQQCHDFNQDLSGWGIPEDTIVEEMFSDCKKLNQDFSSWTIKMHNQKLFKYTGRETMFKDCISMDENKYPKFID